MLCSAPGAGKSGSNWLSRLRSNKGLPTAEDLDLDHFLTQNPNSSSSESAQLNSATTRSEPRGVTNRNREWVGAMNNVLSELFFMDGSDERSKLSGEKIPRKQTNPRVCAASMGNNNSNNTVNSNSSGVVAVTASFNSDSNSLRRRKKGNARVRRFEVVDDGDGDDDVGEEEVEEENEEMNLKGYSRSEVTVIDTSFGCWKSEKLVFRRKNVWKVMEKKCKLRSFGRKKRKEGENDLSWGAFQLKKKAKASPSHHAINGGDRSIKPSSDEGQNFRKNSHRELYKATAENLNTTREEVSTESPDNLSQDFRKRSRLSSSPRKMKKGGSSVVLVKGIPTGKKKAVMLSPNCPKSTQRLHMDNNSPRK
ncbi:uncharacterized protein LOC133834385 isoform X2 [Humulus lupulus]|uniref:uncharacterized protein LOC133834385 isoform X2 n=1 Tax=Humulus lupulus TaxID=3486 RepID=UPI002B40643E|nr:uncharacterized protein LOC133834385 isoform X2 [Humulus lupulus]